MNILTDDELPPLRPQDHPEPHSSAWTEQEMRAIRARDRLVEAAVLAKLREQEPQDIAHVGQGLVDVWKSRAAPLPAVVQVPQGLIEAVDRVLEEAHCDCPHRLRFDDGQHLSGCPLFDLNVARLDMLAAAPLTAVVQVPPGYKLVPVEPGDWVFADKVLGHDSHPNHKERMRRLYRAMLAAAPEAPAQAIRPSQGNVPSGRNALATVFLQAMEWGRDYWAAFSMQGQDQREIAEQFVDKARAVFDAPEAPAQGERTLLEQYDLDQSPEYRKGYEDGRLKGFEAGQRYALEAPAQPSVPAPWREAVKVAREALDWCVAEINRDSPAVKNARPVIAQLDSLEGGE